MIDVTQKKHEKTLTDHLNGQKEDYFGHHTSKTLRTRIEKLRKSNNMDFDQHRFMSKLGFPIQRQVSQMRKFIFDQNFRHPQLFTIKKTEATDEQTAKNIENSLNDNMRRTKFKSLAFARIKLTCAEYGASIGYSVPGVLLSPHKKTYPVTDAEGNVVGYDRKTVNSPDIVIQNMNIYPENYFQDPDTAYPEESTYQGHLERWNIPGFVNYAKQNKGSLRNMVEVMDTIKKSGSSDSMYRKDDRDQIVKYPVDFSKFYSLCDIPGNEDNTSPYYVEMVEGKIIRIEKDIFDENLRPYSVFTFLPRNDVWWGNADGEYVMPHENAANVLNGLKMDNAIRAHDQMMFRRRGSFDNADLNNRRENGGFIDVDIPDGMDLSKVLHQFQSVEQANTTYDAMMREINASRQSMASQPNVNQRVSKTAPLANTTATAVETMNDQGDIKEGSYNEFFNYGLINLGKNNIVLMQQFFPEQFSILTSPGKTEEFLNKSEILGSADIDIRTALTASKAYEAQRFLNNLNEVMNLRGTQDPATMAIRLEPIIKRWLDKTELGDVNEIYDEQAAQQQQQQQVAPGGPIA